jgi:outer membrane receptor protein involved in Fe transport
MMLNEMGGLRVRRRRVARRQRQESGHFGRCALSDRRPALSGEQVGSFGLLQIPPVDLGQVEVIKGVASSLYGAGAMGGVVNLVSRRPGTKPEGQLLVNRSTRGATDAAFWQAAPLTDRWSYALLVSANGQSRFDADDDRWADLPRYARAVLRPRVFWDNKSGRTFFATVGTTIEDRIGGTLPGAVLAATGQPYLEAVTRLVQHVDGWSAR